MSNSDGLARWLRVGASVESSRIRVVLADIDGVLSGGEGQPVEPEVLGRVAAWNDAALTDSTIPAVALCTGRQAPYVELLAQLTHAFVPCLFEHGAGMLEPRRYRFTFNPSLGPTPWQNMAAIREILEKTLVASGRAFIQPGKEATLTVYPVDAATRVDQLATAAEEALAGRESGFVIVRNMRGVEVRPSLIDKGAGARWLSETLGIGLEQFAGIGDADDDLTFLGLVAYPATPANGSDLVRSMARYIAPRPFGAGFLQILDHIANVNRGVESGVRA